MVSEHYVVGHHETARKVNGVWVRRLQADALCEPNDGSALVNDLQHGQNETAVASDAQPGEKNGKTLLTLATEAQLCFLETVKWVLLLARLPPVP